MADNPKDFIPRHSVAVRLLEDVVINLIMQKFAGEPLSVLRGGLLQAHAWLSPGELGDIALHSAGGLTIWASKMALAPGIAIDTSSIC